MTARSAAVVGAGLAGLSAAYRLSQAGWAVQVFESESEVGGRVKSVARDGYIIDTAATALGEAYSSYNELAEAVGLRSEIVPAAPGLGIYRGGRVHVIRMDRLAWSALTTRVLSLRSKVKSLRLFADIMRAKRSGHLDYADMRNMAPIDNEDARTYALRALNAELDQYLCEPAIRTLLIADSSKVSKVELFSWMANIAATKLTALRGGLGRLPKALADKLDVTVNAPVTLVSDRGDHVELQIDIAGASQTRTYDAVVIAAPLPVAARICPDRDAILGPFTRRLDYTTAITVGVATKRAPDCPVSMVALASQEDPEIALLFLDHNKCPDRAPAGRGLIDVHWETAASGDWLDRSDEDISQRSLDTVFAVFPELEGSIEFTHVTRWSLALPLTGPGAYQLMGEFTAAVDRGDRIQFAGDYLSAAGQNTAVRLGAKAARNLVKNHTG